MGCDVGHVACLAWCPPHPSARLAALDLSLVASADLDLPRLRPLRHRQGERQHALVVARRDVLGVDRRTETELATEATLRSLGNEELVALVWLEPPFRPDGEDLILDRDFDRLGVDAGQVEVDDERVA